MKIILILSLLILTASASIAQSNVLDSTLHFTSNSSIDLYTSQVLQDTFDISIGNSFLKIKQGDEDRSLSIRDIQGVWSDIATDGELRFEVPANNFIGYGKVGRENGVYYLILDFSVRKDGLKRKYHITI